jgi:putative acetyltransferase
VLIRRETERDADIIRAITTAAFAQSRPPSQVVPEARLIDELRAGPAWLPALSLVAVTPAGEVIGHVLGTRGHVGQDLVIALGPLAVRQDRQRHGVGSALMHAVLGAADALGEPLAALLGDPGLLPPVRLRAQHRLPDHPTPGRNGSRTSRSASKPNTSPACAACSPTPNHSTAPEPR